MGVAGKIAFVAQEMQGGIRPGKLTPGIIRHMAGEAIKNPQMRDNTLEFLEMIAKKEGKTELGSAAYKAASTILLVEMLEALKG